MGLFGFVQQNLFFLSLFFPSKGSTLYSQKDQLMMGISKCTDN